MKENSKCIAGVEAFLGNELADEQRAVVKVLCDLGVCEIEVAEEISRLISQDYISTIVNLIGPLTHDQIKNAFDLFKRGVSAKDAAQILSPPQKSHSPKSPPSNEGGSTPSPSW